jgi:hypothetical protein
MEGCTQKGKHEGIHKNGDTRNERSESKCKRRKLPKEWEKRKGMNVRLEKGESSRQIGRGNTKEEERYSTSTIAFSDATTCGSPAY